MQVRSKTFVAFLVLMLGPALSARAALIPSPGDDLALGGAVTSTTSTTAFGGLFSYLTDGNRSGNFGSNSVAHTGEGAANQSLDIALGSLQTIGKIIVWNRTDCCGFRINPYQLQIFSGGIGGTEVYNSGSQSFVQDLFISSGGDDASGDITTFTQVLGDTIRITQISAETMNLAELEAYVPEPSSALLAVLGIAGMFMARRRRKA